MSSKKGGKIPHLCFLLDTSSPRRKSAHLGEPEAEFYELFDPPRHSSHYKKKCNS